MEKSQSKRTGQDSSEQTQQLAGVKRLREFSHRRNVIFMALCCSFLLFTVVGMLAHLHATYAIKADITPTVTQSITPTDTTTVTPSPTDTPSPTPTDTPSPTPSPTPTDTPSPTPTATPTSVPTATPTQPRATPTHQPGPTATSTVGNQILPTPTPRVNATATAGASPTPTTANGSGLPSATPMATLTPGNSDNQNSTSPDNSTGDTNGKANTPLLVLGGLAAGLLLLIAVAIFLVRKLLNPVPEQANLPPSGARPWSRTPSPSMDGATNLYSWENAATSEQAWANDPFAKTPPQPAFAAPVQQQNNAMWMPQNPAMGASNAWNTIPATDAGQPLWNAAFDGSAGNPAFANQSPFFTVPDSNGFPVTPGSLPTTGTQWGMSSGNISTPFYAQNGPPITPSNAHFPTILPPSGSGEQQPVGNAAFYEGQLPFPGNATPFEGG